MKGLENDTDAGASRECERVLPHGGEIVPSYLDAPARCLLETGHDHEEGCLARSTGTDDGERIPGSYGQAQVAKDGDLAGAARERKIDIRQLNDGFGDGFGNYGGHSIKAQDWLRARNARGQNFLIGGGNFRSDTYLTDSIRAPNAG